MGRWRAVARALSGCTLLLGCLAGLEARAQFGFSLPEVYGLSGYYEPAVLWLPGGEATARAAGYGFGVEVFFVAVKTPPYLPPEECRPVVDGVLGASDPSTQLAGQTQAGEPCRVCQRGKDAWGHECQVERNRWSSRLGLGYGQVGTYGGAPLLLLGAEGRRLPVHGITQSVPRLAGYLVRELDGRFAATVHVGASLALVRFLGQAVPTSAAGAPPTVLDLESVTLSPGLSAGLATRSGAFAELAYELRHFQSVRYSAHPGDDLQPSILLHSVQLRLGFWIELRGSGP